mgnify:CR=1 FL=1
MIDEQSGIGQAAGTSSESNPRDASGRTAGGAPFMSARKSEKATETVCIPVR